jgi:hypothetical protein
MFQPTRQSPVNTHYVWITWEEIISIKHYKKETRFNFYIKQ